MRRQLNRPLKLAMLDSGWHQREIAKKARLHESRLSRIVRCQTTATEVERRRLARVLGRDEAELFPAAAS